MSIIKKLKNNKLLKDSILSEDRKVEFISTGCASINVLFSGSLDGGIPELKVSEIAADSAQGKSTIALMVSKGAQNKGKEVIYLDTEFAFSYAYAIKMGLDPEKMLVIQDNHIESVQQKVMAIVDELTKVERENLLIVLDSFGGLVTSKSYNDAVDGKDVMDMTVSKKKNNFARLLTGIGCTVFIVNQTFACLGAGTMVQTELGLRPIEELMVGDLVYTSKGLQPISMVVKYDEAFVYEIELEDGTVIESTGIHKFVVSSEEDGVTQQGWVNVEDLTEGDLLVGIKDDNLQINEQDLR